MLRYFALAPFMAALAAADHETEEVPFVRVSNMVDRLSTYRNYHQAKLRSGHKPKNEMPDLMTVDYGCFCRDLTRVTADFDEVTNWKLNVGHPVDEFDRACKSLMDGWVCLKAAGIDIGQVYSSPGNYVASAEEAISECERLNHDEELQKICKVEEKFALTILDLVMNQNLNMDPNPIGEEDDRGLICHPGNQNGRVNYGDMVYCCDREEFPDKGIISNSGAKCDKSIMEYVVGSDESTWSKYAAVR